jgi:hypothetical protein
MIDGASGNLRKLAGQKPLKSVGSVEGGSKWRRGAAEFGGAGLVKVSVGQLGVAVVV